jgi:hypothetical protein
MKGSGVNARNVEKGGKGSPEGGSELCSSVGSYGVRNAKTRNPGGNEGFSTGFGGNGGKRNGF